MTQLFISIVDGQPSGHPMLEENLLQACPHIDVNNLPPEFARFERVLLADVALPLDTFEKATVRYEWVGNVVKDVWYAQLMNEEQRAVKVKELVWQRNYVKQQSLLIWQDRLSQDMTDEVRQAIQTHIQTLEAYVIDESNYTDRMPASPVAVNSDGSLSMKV
jgi:hypothetical protein